MERKLRLIREYKAVPEEKSLFPCCFGCEFFNNSSIGCPVATCTGIIWVLDSIQEEEITDGGCTEQEVS